jgi:cytochrome c2
MWLSSAHARSLEGAVFLAALQETEAGGGREVARLCLRCHAPLAEVVGDTRLERKVSWDGVSCDACHSITAVDTSGTNPRMTFDWGKTKRGPIRDAVSDVHGTAYSPLHTTSLVCVGCHEYTNDEGTAVLSTFSEWKESASAKKGESCLDCHMAKTEANVVDPRVKRVPESSVNLHEVPGGHALGQLHKAIRAKLTPERRGDELGVEVRMNNIGAGHAVPTGMPGRRLVVVVNVRTNDGRSLEEKRIYARHFVDATGVPIEKEYRCFEKGVRIASDTRLRSGEERIERFTFPVPAATGGSIGLKVYYEHSPTGMPEDRTWLTVFAEDRMIPPSKGK